MWRKREIMELQSKTMMQEFIEKVPSDVSGKWVSREELQPFAESILNYVIAKLEEEADVTSTPEIYGVCVELQNDFNL